MQGTIVTAQAAFDDLLNTAKKRFDEDLKQGHSRGSELGVVGLNVPKTAKAAQHLNQQLPSLNIPTFSELANFRQDLDLIAVWSSNDSNKAANLDGALTALLR